MDKNKIKSFAIWARRNLIKAVSEKAYRIGIYEDKIENANPVQGGFKLEGKEEIFNLSNNDRNELVKQVREKGFEQVMEEVAYTWFNRFMGLRYMEVNDYLPSGVRILSSEIDGKKEPDVLTKVSEIIEELGLNGNEIYDLLDTGNTLDREKAYRIILVKQCNELGKIIPQMFEKISDYTELLLPENLLEENSVIRKMVEDIEEDDWREEVEIIGWMYQYYISEKKDEVFKALKKNVKITKENIPAATQLFTPKWIVKYMVENSLGRLWLEGHPNEELQKEWRYYLEEAEQEKEVEEELKKIREEHSKLNPEDIKVLDPCMGSGHILVYAFDVLYEIYKTSGYSEREIPRLILKNNLYGLDIDDRASQLASFALIMKARHYNRRLFREIEREHLELNLCSIQESNSITKEVIEYFSKVNEELETDIKYLVDTFKDAKEFGSILEVHEVNFEAIKERIEEIKEEDNLMFGDYRKTILDIVPMLIKQAEIMSRKYEVCVTNPPYMGMRNMNSNLSKYLNRAYKNTKADLFTVFMKKNNEYTMLNGFTAIINQHSWMFLSSFINFRKHLLEHDTIVNMIHLGARAFDDIGGEVVQSVSLICRNKFVNSYLSKYVKLSNFNNSNLKEEAYLNITNNLENSILFIKKADDIEGIPGLPIAYWASEKVINIFKDNINISSIGETRLGLATSNNDKFIRFWHEILYYELGIGLKQNKAITSEFKWFPISKGGGYRKWYGNNELVVDWALNGKSIKDYKLWRLENGLAEKKNSKCWNEEFYFKRGLTWSRISTSNLGARLNKDGFIFETASPTFFLELNNENLILALFNSKITQELANILNPTLTFQSGNIDDIPVIIPNNIGIFNKINELVNFNLKLSKNDWDSFETSWDFKTHPLLKLLDKNTPLRLSAIFSLWETECEEAFEQLKYNEEELNRIFIDIYGLQDELTPEVLDKDITIRKADRERDVKSFISYAVGCILGRYSVDVDGLVFAGGDFKDKWDLENKKVRKINKDEDGNIISDFWVDSRFLPDIDNVIPITLDEYFEDDIVSRFIEFVKVVYSEETLEENLDFISDSIGRKSSETSRQALRRYFIKDFYKDHLKIYQKRPIYWMFDSGKNDGFKALVYMHRYNEQTVAKVRTDYLHNLQKKYEAEVKRLQLVVDSTDYTTKDRTVAKKNIDRILKQIEECIEYDQVVAYLANEKIAIDLDDGVKVNYAKFQDVKVINSKGKETKMNLLSKI